MFDDGYRVFVKGLETFSDGFFVVVHTAGSQTYQKYIHTQVELMISLTRALVHATARAFPL